MAGRTSEKSKTLEDIFKPIMEDFPARLDEHARECGFVRECEQNPNPERHVLYITGFCSICQNPLTKVFPADFPKEWRICCFCKMIADHIVEHGTYPEGRCFEKRVHKIVKLINLVG